MLQQHQQQQQAASTGGGEMGGLAPADRELLQRPEAQAIVRGMLLTTCISYNTIQKFLYLCLEVSVHFTFGREQIFEC